MHILRGKHSGVVVRLGVRDTTNWEHPGEKGYVFRAKVRADAERYAAKHHIHGTIEIYAAASKGGWTADIIRIGWER